MDLVSGLLFPPSILKLEFKTKEELELMPQTEEEYIHDMV
jgi:transient receptor potential cation channel subfamily M protein 3